MQLTVRNQNIDSAIVCRNFKIRHDRQIKLKSSETFCMLPHAHLWQCRWRHGTCCEAQEEPQQSENLH